MILSAALLAGTTVAAFAQGDKAVQGRPMGGLAISMQHEEALEALSLGRPEMAAMLMGEPAPTLVVMHHTMVRRHPMMHRAM